MPTKLLKKLSPQTVCSDLLTRLDHPGAPAEVVLYDLYGIVSGYKSSKPGSEREWLKFTGEFEAVRIDTGEVFNSGAAFVHQPLQDMMFSRFCQAREDDPNATLKFAIRTSIVAPPKGRASITGYEFRVSPLIESDKVSPLADLRAAAKEQVALLAAPKADKKSEAKTEEKAKK